MQTTATQQKVMVLGANGRFGRAAVNAFAQCGWNVIAQSRQPSNTTLGDNVTSLICDALDADQLIQAAQGVDVIVNALNPDYSKWDVLLPPLTNAIIRVAEASGALLMLPGNVYNFGNVLPSDLHENTPQIANTPKAAQRIAMEQSMAAAAKRGVRSVVIRAGDFIGGTGSWFDQAIAKSLPKGVVTALGPQQLPHAFAYLPDLAHVFVRVAARRAELAPFDVLHYAGLTLTGEVLHRGLEAAVGKPLKSRAMPWWLFELAAPFSPMLRALLAMNYLWQRPHRLVETKLQHLIGEVPHTPLSTILRHELGSLHPDLHLMSYP